MSSTLRAGVFNTVRKLCLYLLVQLALCVPATVSADPINPPDLNPPVQAGESLLRDDFTSLSLDTAEDGSRIWVGRWQKWEGGLNALIGNSDDFFKLWDSWLYNGSNTVADSLRMSGQYGNGPYLHEVSNGTLKLRAYPAPLDLQSSIRDFLVDDVQNGPLDYPYVASMISTEKSFSMNQGYVEIKYRNSVLDRGSHIGAWLMSSDGNRLPEIDIFETLRVDSGGTERFFAYNAWGSSDEPVNPQGLAEYRDPQGQFVQYFDKLSEGEFSEWHVFRFEWSDTQLVWKRDGAVVRRQANYLGSNRMYFLLTFEGASGWSTDPDDSTRWPQEVEIDYIEIHDASGSEQIVDDSPDSDCYGPLRVDSMAVSPSRVSPGDTVTLYADICSDVDFSGNVTMNFDNGNWVKLPMLDGGQIKEEKLFTAQSFVAGKQKSYRWTTTVPTSQSPGSFRSNVAVYRRGDWINKLVDKYGPNDALSIGEIPSGDNGGSVTTCTGPLRIESITVTPAQVSPGDAVTLSADVCPDTSFTGHVTLNFDDGNWEKLPLLEGGRSVNEKLFTGESFIAGQQKSYSWSVIVPQSQTSGTFRSNVSLYPVDDWINKLIDGYGADDALAIQGDPGGNTDGTPENRLCTGGMRIDSITVSPVQATSGDTVNLSAEFCPDTSFTGHVTLNFDDGNWGKIPMLENGQLVEGKQFSNQTFVAGELKTYSWVVAVPPSQYPGQFRSNAAVYRENDWVNKLVDGYGANNALTVTAD